MVIRSAIDPRLQDDDFISFLKKAEGLYSAAYFNGSAKLGILRKAIQGHPALIQFVMFCSLTTYIELVESITIFNRNGTEVIPVESNFQTFNSICISLGSPNNGSYLEEWI